MKVCMINGSPKFKDSCSEYFINEISKLLYSDTEVIVCSANDKTTDNELFNRIYSCHAIIFVFPLYVDALPSHLISFLEALEEYLKQQPSKNIRVYAVSNCGFFEGDQCQHALAIFENYCERTGLIWGFGLGIGAGPFFGESKSIPWQASIKKPVFEALMTLKSGLEAGQSPNKNCFATAKMPRRMYILAAHFGWIKQAKENHLTQTDLYAR